MTGALRFLEHHAVLYRRTWKGTIFVSFVSPLLFLAAMGLGLGSLISSGPVRTVDGVSYLAFLAPGLLAATTMQTAYVETTYPIIQGIAWLTPLAHGVALARGLTTGRITSSAGVDALVLLAYATLGIIAANITMRRRLSK